MKEVINTGYYLQVIFTEWWANVCFTFIYYVISMCYFQNGKLNKKWS